MVKLGLPDGAIRHKMQGDGVPESIQRAVLSGGGGGAPAAAPAATLPARKPAPPPPPPPPKQPAGKVSSLSPDDENVATQYRKMMKMGLPPPAVRHKMNAVSSILCIYMYGL
jgi:hypothetical protein